MGGGGLSVFDVNFLIPEIFLCLSIFLLFSFFLFLTYAYYNYFLILNVSFCWLLSFNFVLLIFLYLKTIPNNFLVFQNIFVLNSSLSAFKIFILFLVFSLLIISTRFIRIERINDFEYFILFCFAILGNLLLISAFDLITIYLVIELQSLVLYVLVTFNKTTLISTEVGLKYFLFGSIASIFLLVGFVLLYSICGTLNFYDLILLNVKMFDEIFFQSFLFLSSCFIFGSFFFKLLIVPFHFIGLDVYEGAPTNLTIYLVVISKIAFFLMLGRFFIYVFSVFFLKLQLLLIYFALISIFSGAIIGLRQRRIKRLFIYSSITHTGFILFSLSVGSFDSFLYTIIYLFVYILITFLFWIIYISLQNQETKRLSIYLSDFVRIVKANNILQFCVVVVLCALAGLPPFIGFWLKVLVFLGALDLFLVLPSCFIIFLNIFSVFFYLRFIKLIYFDRFQQGLDILVIAKENSFFVISLVISLIISFFFLEFIFVFIFDVFFSMVV